MTRVAVGAAVSLMAALALQGCAMQPSGQTEAGWTTLVDGAKGLEHLDRIEKESPIAEKASNPVEGHLFQNAVKKNY